MYTKDWIARLDDYLRMTDSEVLQNAGKVSHALAEQKAKEEYQKFKQLQSMELTPVEEAFMASIETSKVDELRECVKQLKKRSPSRLADVPCRSGSDDRASLAPPKPQVDPVNTGFDLGNALFSECIAGGWQVAADGNAHFNQHGIGSFPLGLCRAGQFFFLRLSWGASPLPYCHTNPVSTARVISLPK
jgi:hypothetical protein